MQEPKGDEGLLGHLARQMVYEENRKILYKHGKSDSAKTYTITKENHPLVHLGITWAQFNMITPVADMTLRSILWMMFTCVRTCMVARASCAKYRILHYGLGPLSFGERHFYCREVSGLHVLVFIFLHIYSKLPCS